MDKLSRTATVKQKLGKTMQRAVLGTKHLLTAVGLKMTVGEADWENAAEQNSPSDYHTNREESLPLQTEPVYLSSGGSRLLCWFHKC